MEGGLFMIWFWVSGGGRDEGVPTVTGGTALARLLLLGEAVCWITGPTLFARFSFSVAKAALRPFRVKGRLATPISCECVEMSARRLIVGAGIDNRRRTARPNFLRIKISLVADRRRAPCALELSTV